MINESYFQAFMTMAAEIKNRVGPPAAAQPGAAGFCSKMEFPYLRSVAVFVAVFVAVLVAVFVAVFVSVFVPVLYLYLYMYLWLYFYLPPPLQATFSTFVPGVKIDSKPVEANKAGGCC